MKYPAPPHMRFAPDAFARNVGNTITLNIGTDMHIRGRMIAAEAEPDMATITLEIEDPDQAVQLSAVIATGVLNHVGLQELDDQES